VRLQGGNEIRVRSLLAIFWHLLWDLWSTKGMRRGEESQSPEGKPYSEENSSRGMRCDEQIDSVLSLDLKGIRSARERERQTDRKRETE
jgi:hypothetical protein